MECPTGVPAQGAALTAPLPLFPADNWWNADIGAAPLDPASAGYIAFINNGSTRKLHPDFGGEASPGSVAIYGMPYAVVDATQPKVAVTFDYWDESDGVNLSNGQGLPFYPIPAQAITQSHWVEGGAPASVDQRSQGDRHLLIVDCTHRHLYELYNVYYNAAQAKWYAGSGAFFDMNANGRRPDTWTSADAAGLAIFPGLVRYDEAWNAAITDIGHAFRVTVRATNGYVYPASHRAGSTQGALPMGARLRLKQSVNGADPALRSADPNVQKIFRAMQKYGLIVADNGSDMYVTGTFDTRWNNGLLNPAFAALSAGDFEVIQLGWKPPATPAPALASIGATPASVTGPASATGTVTLTGNAPAGGAVVALSSAGAAVTVPASVAVAAGASSASFAIGTSAVATTTATSIAASYAGVTRSVAFTVNAAAPPPPPPPPAAAPVLTGLAIAPASLVGGASATGTVTLDRPAPAGGTAVSLASSATAVVAVPAGVVVAAGATAASFGVTTYATRKNRTPTLSASYGSVTKSFELMVKRR
ncbi:MAG: hypothetical protein ABIR52_13640 [Casimicrobiaceae bacterium]